MSVDSNCRCVEVFEQRLVERSPVIVLVECPIEPRDL